jgi:hypothetical protein
MELIMTEIFKVGQSKQDGVSVLIILFTHCDVGKIFYSQKLPWAKNCRVKGYHKPELKCTNIAVGKIFYLQNCPWAETAE